MPRPRSSSRRKPAARDNKHADLSGEVPRVSEEELYARLPALLAPLVLILDGIEDPHNLGACLRSADAAGAHAVIAPKHHAASMTETVRRIACGGAESVPFVQVTNLARSMRKLKDAGLWLVGTADEADQLLYETDLSGPVGIVLGAEGKGMRRLTTENCDFLARIPMHGSVECLNVSVAAGVCLFEAVRQRRTAPKAP